MHYLQSCDVINADILWTPSWFSEQLPCLSWVYTCFQYYNIKFYFRTGNFDRWFAYIGVQHKLCCVFVCIVYPSLPVSLDCSFLIAPSVFSTVYFIFITGAVGGATPQHENIIYLYDLSVIVLKKVYHITIATLMKACIMRCIRVSLSSDVDFNWIIYALF